MTGGGAKPRQPAAAAGGASAAPQPPTSARQTSFPGQGHSLAPQPTYDSEVKLLTDMGFGAAAARSALQASGGDVERAITKLSEGGGLGATGPPQPPADAPTPGFSPEAMAAAAEATAADLSLLGDRLSAMPAGGACLQLLRKLIGNVRDSPAEPKFRKIRLSNAKIASALGGRAEAIALLCACGFTLDATGEFAEIADAAAMDAPALEWACCSLDSAVAQAANGGPPVPRGPSEIKVLVAPEGGTATRLQDEVGEDYYALTPAEIKAIMDANAARVRRTTALPARFACTLCPDHLAPGCSPVGWAVALDLPPAALLWARLRKRQCRTCLLPRTPPLALRTCPCTSLDAVLSLIPLLDPHAAPASPLAPRPPSFAWSSALRRIG